MGQAIYLWMDTMIFFSEEANKADDASDMILRLHVKYFANDVDDFGGFVEYHGGEDNPFVERLVGLLASIKAAGEKTEPFRLWYPVDAQFKDLVGKMTCLDPKRRITARDALEHPWFKE